MFSISHSIDFNSSMVNWRVKLLLALLETVTGLEPPLVKGRVLSVSKSIVKNSSVLLKHLCLKLISPTSISKLFSLTWGTCKLSNPLFSPSPSSARCECWSGTPKDWHCLSRINGGGDIWGPDKPICFHSLLFSPVINNYITKEAAKTSL